MHKKNSDKFLEKIVKKDYNNELERILEKKYFNENVKNILLNILYKIETSYKDYQKVKQDVISKEEFIKQFIMQIRNNCETIKLVQPHSEESKIIGNKTFLVEKAKKRIICYPIERKLLYCISKISNKEKIVKSQYPIIEKTLSDLINVGYNINAVEPIRDFNGYSWTIIPREIESTRHNLIYQNLRILIGNHFLNSWVQNKENIIDYVELLNKKMESEYGIDSANKIIFLLKELSILLDFRYDRSAKGEILNSKKYIDLQYKKVINSESFIMELTNKKRELSMKIKQIDETINNKKMLEQEYIKRNEKLPLNDKIFSVRILSQLMENERSQYLNEIEELNNLLNPNNYMKYRNDIHQQKKYLDILNYDDIDNQVNKYIIYLQQEFYKCYKIKIKKTKTKQDMINLIYEFRYYCMTPFNQEKYVFEVTDIQKEIEYLKREIINKASTLKVINIFSENEEINYDILKNIFELKIIDLEELSIKITKEKDIFYVQLFDQNVFEHKNIIMNGKEINKKELKIKLNKKSKIFNK